MTGFSTDAVMQALAYPFERLDLAMPEGPLMLANAVPGAGWSVEETMVWQWWKGPAAQFERDGFTVLSDDLKETNHYAASLLRLPRQREEAQFAIMSCWAALRPGGLFMVAAANDAGGSRLEKDLQGFLPALQTASKHKCRIVWDYKQTQELPAWWLEKGLLQRSETTQAWTRPGLFSWDRIDPATALLLAHLPGNVKGHIADAGCGTGVIAAHVLRDNPGVTSMLCIDADARAVEACRKNLGERHPDRVIDYRWDDFAVSQSWPVMDAVIMNPPFHAEKTLAVTLGQSFIRNAAAMLRPGGSLWLVANAHLPYEDILKAHFKSVEKPAERQGFKVLHAIK